MTQQLSVGGDLPQTQLTEINFQGCSGLTTRALHYLLMHSPHLHNVYLKAQEAVRNSTCEIIASSCLEIKELNLSRCPNLNAHGIRLLADRTLDRGDNLSLIKLWVSGLRHMTDSMMLALGKAAPFLEVLDLGYCDSLHNSSLEAFVFIQSPPPSGVEVVNLSSGAAGRGREDGKKHLRRVTKLRHLVLSSCVLLTDDGLSNLSHALPRLEFLELAGIGDAIKDEGLVHLLQTIPHIRRLDLEDCSAISDDVLNALTPSSSGDSLQTGNNLELLNVSYASEISNEALLTLIEGCSKLQVLEADNTRMGSTVVKDFIKLCRSRGVDDARIVATDCRGVGETVIKEMAPTTRARLGWVGYEARKLKYLDGRDEGAARDLKIGQDECDSKLVILKSFHSWQTGLCSSFLASNPC